MRALGEELTRYYDNVTAAILSADPELTKVTHTDEFFAKILEYLKRVAFKICEFYDAKVRIWHVSNN